MMSLLQLARACLRCNCCYGHQAIRNGHEASPAPHTPSANRRAGRPLCLPRPRYDPSLPPVEGPGDITEEHVAWAEDHAMETALK